MFNKQISPIAYPLGKHDRNVSWLGWILTELWHSLKYIASGKDNWSASCLVSFMQLWYPTCNVLQKWEQGYRERIGHQVWNHGSDISVFLSVNSIRLQGSAAINLCYVAKGRADVYYEFGIHCWDIAAGILIAEEAGGAVMSSSGMPFHSLCITSRPSLVHIKTFEILQQRRFILKSDWLPAVINKGTDPRMM